MNNIFKNFSEFGEASNKCPLCGKKINLAQAQVIEKKQSPVLLFVACPMCKGSIILAIINDIFGVASLGVVTDMTIEDVKRFKGKKKISDDEFLDIYSFLARKKGVAEQAK